MVKTKAITSELFKTTTNITLTEEYKSYIQFFNSYTVHTLSTTFYIEIKNFCL